MLVPGAAAPKLVTRDMLKSIRNGVVHYCVANMPGGVARTSTFALTNATLPHVIALADKGWRKALSDDPNLREGLNVHRGQVTYACWRRSSARRRR